MLLFFSKTHEINGLMGKGKIIHELYNFLMLVCFFFFFSNIIGFKPIIVEWNGTHVRWLLLCYYLKKKKKMVKLCELIFCLKLDLYPRFTLSFCGYFMLVFYISMWMIVLHKPRFGNVNKKTILGQHNSLFAYASLVV